MPSDNDIYISKDIKYEEKWDFYMTTINDQPCFIRIDLALYDIAPIRKYNQFIRLTVKVNDPTDNGLPKNSELAILSQIEDSICHVATNHSIFVGVMTSNHFRHFFFYTSDPTMQEKKFHKAMSNFENYKYSIKLEKDEKWSDYIDILYPDEVEFETIANRHVLENLESHGDKLIQTRNVHHYSSFQNIKKRGQFILEIVKEGFRVEEYSDTDLNEEYPYGIRYTRIDNVGYHEIDDLTLPLFHLSKEFEGIYKGWECQAITE